MFPYICECGFNTMDTQRARAHVLETCKLLDARVKLICPKCNTSDVPHTDSLDLPFDGHLPFYVTRREINDAGGSIVCEYCETECIETREENE